jgi:hypothetical protein
MKISPIKNYFETENQNLKKFRNCPPTKKTPATKSDQFVTITPLISNIPTLPTSRAKILRSGIALSSR